VPDKPDVSRLPLAPACLATRQPWPSDSHIYSVTHLGENDRLHHESSKHSCYVTPSRTSMPGYPAAVAQRPPRVHAHTRDTQHLARSNTAGLGALYDGSNKADMRAPHDPYTQHLASSNSADARICGKQLCRCEGSLRAHALGGHLQTVITQKDPCIARHPEARAKQAKCQYTTSRARMPVHHAAAVQRLPHVYTHMHSMVSDKQQHSKREGSL